MGAEETWPISGGAREGRGTYRPTNHLLDRTDPATLPSQERVRHLGILRHHRLDRHVRFSCELHYSAEPGGAHIGNAGADLGHRVERTAAGPDRHLEAFVGEKSLL